MELRAVKLGRPGQVALLIAGRIDPGDAAQLQGAGRLLAPGEAVALVVLNSPGGAVGEASAMARQIRALGVPVLVPSRGVCASACFLLFAAGAPRFAEAGAHIGVHSASVSGGGENRDTLATTALMAREAAAYGVPPSITGRMVTTAPGAIAWLAPSELAAMAVRLLPAGASSGTGAANAPGSGAGPVSDWTRGFQFGEAHPVDACEAPHEAVNAGDWRLGCRSGQSAR
jgi:hypothetical protein